MAPKVLIPWSELEFSAVRSSGAGGQNVNKTNSAVILRWNLRSSSVIPEEQKTKLLQILARQLTLEGEILIRSERQRDQAANKKDCVEKLVQMLKVALTPRKKRQATKPTRSSKRKRLDTKRAHSEKKQLRSKIED
jgi:ribosome-associated protein